MNLASGAGQLGVMLFFILSGFLMSHLYMQKEYNKSNVRNYIVSRAARVLPLFLLIVVLSYLAQGTSAQDVMYDIPTVNSLLSHLLLLNGVSVLWTIAPEVQFYVIFIAIWALSRGWLGLLLAVAGLIMVVLFFWRFPDFEGEAWGLSIKFTLFRCLPYFISGVVMGFLYSRLVVPNYLRSGWFVLTLLFIPLLYPRVYFALKGVVHGSWQDFGVLMVLTFVFFSVVFLVPDKNVFLANKLGDFLGKISYSLYLLHMPVLFLLLKFEISSLEVTFFCFIVLCLVTSYTSYRLIERPSSALIRRLRR